MNKKIPWSENDKLFKQELESGYKWQKLPALYFELLGFSVSIPDLSVRESIKDAKNWLNSVDLFVNDYPIEIKSRNEIFTSPDSFPYKTIFIDTVSGWLGKINKPIAYIMVSRKTGSMLWIDTKDYEDKWLVETKIDRVRGIRESFFTVDRGELKSLDSLVTLINSKKYES